MKDNLVLKNDKIVGGHLLELIMKFLVSKGLKGFCHEMNIFLNAYDDKKVLSVYTLTVFKAFLSLS